VHAVQSEVVPVETFSSFRSASTHFS